GLRDYGTTGLRDYGTTGPRDHGTTGLRDYGTTGPRDHGTTGPRDHGTTGPRDYRDHGPSRACFQIQIPKDPAISLSEPEHGWNTDSQKKPLLFFQSYKTSFPFRV